MAHLQFLFAEAKMHLTGLRMGSGCVFRSSVQLINFRLYSSKICRISTSQQCRKYSFLTSSWTAVLRGSNHFTISKRNLGGPGLYHDENLNAFRILQTLPNYQSLLFEYDESILLKEDELRASTSTQQGQNGTFVPALKPGLAFRNSVLAFIESAYASQEAQLPITHPKNEETVGHVLKDLSQLTDAELCQVLYHIRLFPPCPSSRDPPFYKIWTTLDQECLSRSTSWSLDFNFVVADLWYGISLARLSEFHFHLIKRLFRKCDKLKKEHFVRFMFCLNLNRELPPHTNAYDLEYSVGKLSSELTAEEIVIIAMAFFKTQRPIRENALLNKLLASVMKKSDSLDSVSIAAMAKIARYSSDRRCSQMIKDFQEAFLPKIPRLSSAACTHLALTGTNALAPHLGLVQTVVNRIEADISDARLKELERVLLAATMFNVDCDKLCSLIVKELQDPARADEIRKYGRCLPAILHYLSIKNVFVTDLISTCLSKTFRDTYFGRGKETFQRELLCLDFVADIEIPDYTGHRLEAKTFDKIMRKNMLHIKPPSKLKVSVYERFIRSVSEAVGTVLADKDMFHLCCILPQHQTMAVVYCRDKENKLTQIPQSYFEHPPHQIKKIEGSLQDLNYHAILLCSRSFYCYNTKDLTGQANLQIRQTKKLGYKTQLILFCDWEELHHLDERKRYIAEMFQQNE